MRAFYSGWYNELVTGLPRLKNREVTIDDAPGLGTELLPEVLERADTMIRRSVPE